MKNALVTLSILLATATYNHLVFAQSIDRPSAQQPQLPNYLSEKKDNTFILPPVLPQSAVTPNLLNARKVFIAHIHLKENTVFSEQALRPLITPYEGREVSIAELEELRQKLTHYYTDKGYIDSGAVFIANSFKNGELTVRFVEGKIDELHLHGLERLNANYIKNRLLANENAPLNINELQDNFQKLLSDPLIKQMNGRILPTNEAGHSILDVAVTRARSYHWSLVANNYRPPSIGAEAFALNTSINNLTGFGDTIDFTFMTSEGSNRYAGGFKVPLTSSDTQAFFHFDEGDSSLIEAPIKAININSKIHSLEGGFSQPLINTLQQKFIIGTSFAVRENETYIFGNNPFSFIGNNASHHNQATVWRGFQDYTQRWQKHAIALRSTFSLGLNALGATPKTNSHYASGEFFSWLGQGQYAYLIHENTGTQAVIRGNAQLSDLPLLPLEQLSIGGVNTVRGYRENYLVRDQGYNISFELHYPLIGNANTEQHVMLIPFVDYGQAWNHNESVASIYSVGIGVQWHYRFLQSEVFYGYALAHPNTKQSGDIQDDGIHFQIKLSDAI
ncbi:MAG: ShlB/FhaC/HecB family hemolysin secretion/activation protein [Methylococcaceae bacterium]